MEKPTFDHASPTPLFVQIKEWMAQEIHAGHWPERYKLPAEGDLAPLIGVSRGTLRKAIGELVAEGLLTQIHGKGTFVAAGGIAQPLAERLAAFSELLTEQGIPYTTQVLRQEVQVPTAPATSLLRLTAGQSVLFLARLRLVEGVPVAYMENQVPLNLAPGLDKVDFAHHGLFQTLENPYGLELAWGQRVFEAVPADQEKAERLQVAPGVPLFYIDQVVYLSDGTPVERSEVWLRGDRFRLSATVQRKSKARAGLAAAPGKLSF